MSSPRKGTKNKIEIINKNSDHRHRPLANEAGNDISRFGKVAIQTLI